MIIQEIPTIFQPSYKSNYPEYSSGKNIEEICFQYFLENKDSINSEYIYLPVFWTSYYVINNFFNNLDILYTWLNTLNKNKKYFTIVQCALGIFVQDFNLNITVFSAGGGGVNLNNKNTINEINYYGVTRSIFYGNKGNYDIPLICNPLFPCININKDIFCSFMGRFDTHKCRFDMKKALQNDSKFKIFNSVNFEEYKNILNRSIFTLAPRGFGYTSFRIYEAILANSIPIYIWEDKKILPYSDEINWEDISIIIHTNDINTLPEILSNINIKKMQNNILEVKHKFSFDYINNYIVKNISIK